MWHDLPPPGTESISLPGGAAKRLELGLGDGPDKEGVGGCEWMIQGQDKTGQGHRLGDVHKNDKRIKVV